MKRVKLSLDMADREWFEPYTTIVAEADTSDVGFFYAPFDKQVRAARLRQGGRELVLYAIGDAELPWSKGFGAVIADMGSTSWSEAIAMGFVGVRLVGRGKAFVELEA